MNLEISSMLSRIILRDNEDNTTESFETREELLSYLKVFFEKKDYEDRREKLEVEFKENRQIDLEEYIENNMDKQK